MKTFVDVYELFNAYMKKVNNPNRINLSSISPQWRLFPFFLIHFFATGSAVRANLFYWDGLQLWPVTN